MVDRRTALLTELTTNFPTNVAGSITAAIFRTFMTNVIETASVGIQPSDKTANFTISSTDQDGTFYTYSGTSAGVATLSQASTFPDNYFFMLYRAQEQIVLAPSGSDTINGSTSSIIVSKQGNMVFVIKTSSTTWLALTVVNDFSGIADGFVPRFDSGGNLVQSSIEELTDRIRLTKTLEVPGGSLRLAGSQRLSAGTRCLIIEDTALGQTGFVHPHLYNSSGSITPRYINLGAVEDTVRQALNNENSPVTPYSFVYTVPENHYITGLKVDANSIATGSFTIRLTDQNGGILAESGMINLSVGMNTVMLPNGMVLNQNDVLHITIEGDTGGGALKGGTVSGSFVPYFETVGHDFTELNLDFANDVVGAALEGTNNIRFTRRDGTTFDVDLSAGGVVYHPPTVDNFAIVGLPSRIDTITSLAGDHNCSFTVDNIVNLQNEALNVVVNSTTVHTFSSADTNEGTNSATFNISSAEWTTIVTPDPLSLVFKLTGTDTQSNLVESNTLTVQRRNLSAHEYIYDGLSSTNNPGTIDLATMDQTEITGPGTYTVGTGTRTSGQYYIILVPNDHDITEILDTVLSQSVLSIFTRTANVRTINAVLYHSYVIGPVNAGDNEDYVLTLS